MPNRKTSSKLVEDRFLTKKFKFKNQHRLSFWLKDLAPDDDWFLGELAFKGVEERTQEVKTFAFSVYVNQNHNTINIAQLDCKHIKSDEQLVESAYEGKKIMKVFAVKNVKKRLKDDAIEFQTEISQILMRYVDNEAYKSAERLLNKK